MPINVLIAENNPLILKIEKKKQMLKKITKKAISPHLK